MYRKFRNLALILAIVMAFGLIAACQPAAPAATSTPAPATAAPTAEAPKGPTKTLKIGAINPFTGTAAVNAGYVKTGWEMYLKEKNYTFGDYKVEIIYEDDANNAEQSLLKAKKLVEQDKVDVLMGAFKSNCSYAVAEYAVANKIPFFTNAGADDLTQRKASPYVFRANLTSSLTQHAFADYVYKQLGYRKIAMITFDYAWGHELAGGFHRVFEELGGKIVSKSWPPSGTTDYASYLAQIKIDDVDAVWCNFDGTDAVRFIKQYYEFGYGKKPLLGGCNTTDEHVLYELPEEVVGVYSAMHWCGEVDAPAVKEFNKAYKAATGVDRVASYYTPIAYTIMKSLEHGIINGGDIKDIDSFVKAIKSKSFDSPIGEISIGDYNQAVLNVYVRKVEKVNGVLTNKLVYTYPNVSQFWTYDPAWFLAQPVYSRDYPPLKP